jgi:hypothetical protein
MAAAAAALMVTAAPGNLAGQVPPDLYLGALACHVWEEEEGQDTARYVQIEVPVASRGLDIEVGYRAVLVLAADRSAFDAQVVFDDQMPAQATLSPSVALPAELEGAALWLGARIEPDEDRYDHNPTNNEAWTRCEIEEL